MALEFNPTNVRVFNAAPTGVDERQFAIDVTNGVIYYTDAATGDWSAISGGGGIGGSDTQIQFNDNGAFGGSALFTWSLANGVVIGDPNNTEALVGNGLQVYSGGASGTGLYVQTSGSDPVAVYGFAEALSNQTTAWGIRAFVGANGAGVTLDTAYVFKADGVVPIAGSVVTNGYGLFVEDQTLATNNWAIKTGLGWIEHGDSSGTRYMFFDPSTGELDISSTDANDTLFLSAYTATNAGDATGLYVQTHVNNGIAAGHSWGVYLTTPRLGAGSTIVESYGMQIEDITGATSNWAIKTGAGTNYFGDVVIVHRNTAPADGLLAAGDLAFWLDDTNGATKAMFKAKQADGTVRTGSVSLS